MDKTTQHQATAQLIDELGGPVKLAAVCGVSPSAVTQWKENGIPDARYQYLRLRFPKAAWHGVLVAKRPPRAAA